MGNQFAIGIAAIAALACASSLRAHHAGSMFDTTPIWIKGTVVRFERVNPHTITMVEERSGDGQIHRWAVEGPGSSQLSSRGISEDVPQVGEVIEFCAFAYKPEQQLSRLFPGVDFSMQRASVDSDGLQQQFVTGHVLVTPDGQKQLWGAQGQLGECIGSASDPIQAWLDFLNTNPRGREVWCSQRQAAIQSTALSREFVDEINSLLVDSCE